MIPLRLWFLLVLFCCSSPLLRAEEESATPPETEEISPESETEAKDHMTDTDEAEEKGIIPAGASVVVSTGPITPLAAYFEKSEYTSGLETLARAEELWKKGEAEAASDLALEAYDDLMVVPLPRIRKKSKNKSALQKKRDQIRSDRRRAATLYVQSSIAYVQAFAKKTKDVREGRDRLNDLRDVAINYPDLNRMLYRAMDEMK